MTDIPNREWYANLSRERGVAFRCPFATVESCPRYYQSLSLLGKAGSTKIPEAEDERLSSIGNQATFGRVQTSRLHPYSVHLTTHQSIATSVQRLHLSDSGISQVASPSTVMKSILTLLTSGSQKTTLLPVILSGRGHHAPLSISPSARSTLSFRIGAQTLKRRGSHGGASISPRLQLLLSSPV